MNALTRCDGVRVGGLGLSLGLHVLAITVACLPAVLPDRVSVKPSPPLQWVGTVEPATAPPPVALPPPPAPPPRPPRAVSPAHTLPSPATRIPLSDLPTASEPASPTAPAAAASTVAAVPAAAAIATTAATAPPVLAEGALAYAFVREPVYPVDALRRGEQGTVLLRVSVAADGSIERVEIERGSGSSRLDRAAREAVRQWRFRPPLVDGVPTAAVGIVPVLFRLPARV